MRRGWLASLAVGGALMGCATIFPPPPSGVSFQSTPPGAEVQLNGITVGRTPVSVPVSCTTRQAVSFTLAGYQPFTQLIPTVPGWDGRATMQWPADHCVPVISVTLAPLSVQR